MILKWFRTDIWHDILGADTILSHNLFCAILKFSFHNDLLNLQVIALVAHVVGVVKNSPVDGSTAESNLQKEISLSYSAPSSLILGTESGNAVLYACFKFS